MLQACGLLLILLSTIQAQHADFNGVWRLRSTQPPAENLMLISTKGDRISMKNFSQNGSRYTLNEIEFAVGTERTGTLARMPAKFKATWEGSSLILEWATEWPWGEQSEHHRWTLSPDGKSFHDDSSDTFKTRVRQHSSDFDRAPAETAKFFDYPEQNSADHFKNVQVLKDLPSSALTPLMGTYQAALGVDCTFCHNQAAYDSDENPHKKTARKMISMTLDLNRREFQGNETIVCFTCHRGKATPARQ